MESANLSHVVSLHRPTDGLVARLALIKAAERTLDVQYYLWDSDAVGYLLLTRLMAAARRGVKVRLLVDDMKLRSRTRAIASLCLHPNLEVRVFNPWRRRSSGVAQGVEFIRHFTKLDQRMHNKLLVADNERAIFGGRNVAAEHFGLGAKFNLVDFDLLLSGTEVSDLSDVFDSYWESPLSTSGAAIDDSVSEVDLETTRALIADQLQWRTPALSAVLEQEDGWNEREASSSIPLSADSIAIVSDEPGLSGDTKPTRVIEALRSAVDDAQRELVVVTPFFVPGEIDVEWYGRMIDRGVRIRVLTNSLASNEGTVSNSGLNEQRLALVAAGVELYELRTDAAAKSEWDTSPRVARFLGLHAKLYTIDAERVFLGSLNLDPRSKFINTEVGALISNARLAEEAAEAIIRLTTPDNAWHVEIGADGRVQWKNDIETRHRPPARSPLQGIADMIFGLLPIRDYI